MQVISLIVVDDHPLFRKGVVDALEAEEDLRVVAEAADGEEGLSLIRSKGPDVAVVDINLPKLNGLQLARRLKAEKRKTRIIFLTAYDDVAQRSHAMHIGAAAYCTKDLQPERLVEIVRFVAAGGWLWAEEQDSKPSGAPGDQFWFDGEDEDLEALSSREMEILVQVTSGLSNKEIASLLGISHQTVKNHVTSILRKLDVEDRTQAALFALRRGWVRLNHGNQ